MSDEFSYKFYLEHKDGIKLYPIRVKNRDTGKVAFRISLGGKKGNTKELGLEIENEDELKSYIFGKGYAIRVSTLDKKVKGLYKIGHRSILRAVESKP